MKKDKIPGGYYIKARQIKDSWVAHASPVVREVWDYLLREANHKDIKYGGYTVKRGQLFRTYRQIIKDLSWTVGFRSQYYHESSMKRTMNGLMKEGMIELMSEPWGTLITIVNYDYFQNQNNYARPTERTSDEPLSDRSSNQVRTTNNKNENNENKENKHICANEVQFAQMSEEDFFNLFWQEYPKKKGKIDALKAMKQVKPTNGVRQKIFKALEWQKRSDEWAREGGQYIPYPAGWLRAGCWDDEPMLFGDNAEHERRMAELEKGAVI